MIDMIKLPIFILMWIVMLAIKIPTVLLGLLMVLLLYPYRNTDYSNLPFWTRPWANPEDWEGMGTGNNSLPIWWVKSRGNTFKCFYRYHAIRNPANGLRSFEWLDLDITPDLIKYKTNIVLKRYEPGVLRKSPNIPQTVWYLAWQGFRAGFKLIHIWSNERHLVIKFGWRIEPRNATDEVSKLEEDSSFASKILLYRKG